MFDLTARTMVYQGAPDLFTDVQFIIETTNGKTYTYDIDVTSEYFSIMLNEPNEDNFEEDTFEADVSDPVTIKIKYRYYILKEGSDPQDPEYETSDLIELICYNDFQFEIGH